MHNEGSPTLAPATAAVLTPLAVTLLVQVVAAALMMAGPVLAPVLTAAAGVAPQRIGDYSALIAVGMLWHLTLVGRVMARTGPLRLLQISTLVSGTALVLALTGWWPAILAAALFVGYGYAPNAPAASEILARTTPPGIRSLVFSIKQSGVPLGGALAGLALPFLVHHLGWQGAILCFTLGALVTVAVVQPWRGRFDAGRRHDVRLRPTEFVSPMLLREPFRAMRLSPAQPRLALAGAAFAVVQGSVFSFHVTFLVDAAHLSLETAGAAFAVLQVAGAVSRVALGWVADRITARTTLILLSLASAGLSLALMAVGPDWPLAAILVISAGAGCAAASWNGVYLGEVARTAPPGAVGQATAGSIFFTFTGYGIGTAAFGWLIGLTGNYHASFALIAVLVLIAAVALRRPLRETEPYERLGAAECSSAD